MIRGNAEMAELIRECNKARPTTFCEVSFPICQEIDTKIKSKNIALRKSSSLKYQDRLKLQKNEERR